MTYTPPPAGPESARNELAAMVYPRAVAYAERKGRGNDELTERLRDAATDAIMRALDRYKPDRGTFVAYAMTAVRRTVGKAFGEWLRSPKRRITTHPLSADDLLLAGPERSDTLDADSLRVLPPELRQAVELYCIDRRTMHDAAKIAGITTSGFQHRLVAAAERLAGKKAPPRHLRGRLRRD